MTTSSAVPSRCRRSTASYHRSGTPYRQDHRDRPRIVTSRTRATPCGCVVANVLGCDAIRLGSAGAKAMAVVLGDADIYLHDGGMYQWDSAAPAAVAIAAGLHVSRIDGSPIVYNDRDPWLPDLIVCRVRARATMVLTPCGARGSPCRHDAQ